MSNSTLIIIGFVMGLVYIVSSIILGIRLDERCRNCVSDFIEESTVRAILVMAAWPALLPACYLVYRIRSKHKPNPIRG